eukprot:c41252_g1_i1 orf=72-317(+)
MLKLCFSMEMRGINPLPPHTDAELPVQLALMWQVCVFFKLGGRGFHLTMALHPKLHLWHDDFQSLHGKTGNSLVRFVAVWE